MYQALYRKYRPATFSEVYGQEHITKTLQNSLAAGKVSHAYLFTGTRGTGKTSCAKILAKAVCCLEPKNGEPCGHCAACRAIAEGAATDVLEIDAASNNGVNDIRELREQVNFLPAALKYRVYIIDEVHMLSASAFNALLKTLEEPPAHIVFILATTEVHKLPATILSRCQRFDFKRLEPAVLCRRMQYIANKEGFTLTESAAELIAGLADGGMRDALSILDQCSSCYNEITDEVILSVCGIAGSEVTCRLVQGISEGNTAAVLNLLDELYKNSVDLKKLLFELVTCYRNLMILKTVRENRSLIVCSNKEYETLKKLAEGLSLSNILQKLSTLQAQAEGPGALTRADAELVLVKLCVPELNGSLAGLEKRVAALEEKLAYSLPPQGAVQQGTNPAGATAAAGQAAPVYPAYGSASVNKAKPGPELKTQPQPVAANEPPLPEPPLPEPPQFEPAEAPLPEPPQGAIPVVPEPPTAAAHPAAPPAESAEMPVLVQRWPEILEALRSSCPLLAGVLRGSKAYTKGTRLLVDCKLTQFREMINSDAKYRDYLKHAAAQVLGVAYNLGPYNPEKYAVQEPDPLAQFAKSLENKNFNE